MAVRFQTQRLVVRPHRPGRQALLLFAGLIIVGIAAWMSFEYGQWQQLYARMTALARAPKTDLEVMTLEELKVENAQLKQRVAILERAAQIDREADARLNEHLRALQDETYEVKEELEFYRNVVSSSKNDSGLRIQAMRVTALGEHGRFHYKLVLTNLNKNDKVTAGSVSIEISGKRGGEPQKFQVTAPNGGSRTTALAFRFVHFHRLEGDITLPDGFDPESVRVVVREGSIKEPRQDASYDWTSLVEAEG